MVNAATEDCAPGNRLPKTGVTRSRVIAVKNCAKDIPTYSPTAIVKIPVEPSIYQCDKFFFFTVRSSMDTRYWGPSGWDLFHRIAFHSEYPDKVLEHIAEVLPCKFCRNSTRKYIKELPYDKSDPARWLYDIHNKVNHKLRSQCSKDPKVVDPGPDPSFEEVQHKYRSKKLDVLVGQEFLSSIAVNYSSTPRKTEIQKRFIQNLGEAYPKFKTFVQSHPPDFSNYAEWMTKFTGVPIEKVEQFKSKCKHGKTCRKPQGGGKRLAILGVRKKTQRK